MIGLTRDHVSVLMPVYNGSAYLREAVESILSQSYQDWELIIADDGSTDASRAIAYEYARRDDRVRLVSFPHRGLVQTLNSGVRLCSGRYLFRMDSDDVSMPRRLELQTRYLDENPNVVVLGCAAISSLAGRVLSLTPPSPTDCRWQLVFRNCIGHPGVAIRVSALDTESPYREEYFLAEDFKLWSDLSIKGEVHVLPDPLIFYRKHNASISHKYAQEQVNVDRRVLVENVRHHLGLDVSSIAGGEPVMWACGLIDRILDSCQYKVLTPCERRALRRGLEIYVARFGIRPFLHFIMKSGAKDIFSRPVLTATNFLRSLEARGSGEKAMI